MIKRFKMGKLLVADEAFNNVSVDYQPNVSRLLSRMAHDHGYTIFAVTHQPIMAAAADNIYQLTPHEGAPPTVALVTVEQALAELQRIMMLEFEKLTAMQKGK